VLGVPRDASAATIKAAWRKLAREHHPDLAAGSAGAEAATRRMVEINRAYDQLRNAADPRPDGRNGNGNGAGSGTGPAAHRAQWPPRERPSRPVTGRVDTSSTFRPRNTTTGPHAARSAPPPYRGDRLQREPLRASQPNGPLSRRRQRNFRPPTPPTLDAANALVIEFGKFHGHTLGQVAAFEPSYIDWLAKTISRDPDLVAAARVVQADLDARDVHRHPRPTEA
jgi:hypothetical protein